MNEREILLKIDGFNKGDQIPLLLLADIFKGLQQALYLTAITYAKRDVKKRARIPQDIQRACELRRVFESPGSYQMIARVAEPQQKQISLLEDENDIGLISCKNLLEFIDILSKSADWEKLSNVIPDSSYLRKILRTMETFFPKAGDDWHLTLGSVFLENEAVLTSNTSRVIGNILIEPEIEQRVITGKLMRLHLDEKRLGILYPPSGRVLDCYYDPEIEEFIIQNLKDIIQVRGTVQLDKNGEPDKIIDVSDIMEVDLRPVTFRKIVSDKVTLIFKDIIELYPSFNESSCEYEIEIPEINLFVSGITREEMVATLKEDLIWLWQEYVIDTHDPFSDDAKQLRNKLKQLIEEVPVHE